MSLNFLNNTFNKKIKYTAIYIENNDNIFVKLIDV